MALSIQRAPPAEPVGRIGLLDFGIGDGLEIRRGLRARLR